jgi:hypothetical protein
MRAKTETLNELEIRIEGAIEEVGSASAWLAAMSSKTRGTGNGTRGIKI